MSDPSDIENINEDKSSGADIYLTIDSQIQHIVERELKEGIEEMGAEKGMAIVMRPRVGRDSGYGIISLC